MASDQPTALRVIFAFFLGLMVTAFIGVGVYTFYPPGLKAFEEQSRDLRDRQQQIRDARGSAGLTEGQQADLAALSEELHQADQQMRQHQESWARTTSIILVVFATLVMAVSLIRADRLPVISNGLLLGGVLTMLYGTGWTLASGDSRARFWVMAVALLVTLLLGYVRFVRRHSAAQPTLGSASELGDLEARVSRLEQKMTEAAEAMRRSP
jgi:outer membrane murein-binding lipoprotein Lpp